jgi:hypothetical protein
LSAVSCRFLPFLSKPTFQGKIRKFHKSLHLGRFRLVIKDLGRDFDSRHLHHFQIVEAQALGAFSSAFS